MRKYLKLNNVLSIALLLTLCVQAQKADDPGEFPQYYNFRGEYKPWSKDSELWEKQMEGTTGIIKKFFRIDELDRVNLETQIWAKNYKKNNPSTNILLHWNARELRNDQRGFSDQFSPFHWVAFPGTTLVKKITKGQEELFVEDINPLIKGKYVEEEWENSKELKTSKFFFPVLLVVAVDENGNKNWNQYEYIHIEAYEPDTNKIIVQRGKALSKAKSFEKGAYICPMSTRLANKGVFDVNLSAACPRDENGKNGADLMLETLKEKMKSKKASFLDGIAFDVLQWKPRTSEADTDFDGIADGGIISGEDKWREGTYDFMVRLREQLGEEAILTADAYQEINQRGIGLFNGIESEGLVEHNDAFRSYSKTINVFSYWSEKNPVENKLSYIVGKYRNKEDQKNQIAFNRLGIATATALGAGWASLDVKSDELSGGKAIPGPWLGKPIGTMKELVFDSPDVLQGEGVNLTEDFLKHIKSNDCNVKKEGKELIITPKGNHEEHFEYSFDLNNLLVGNEGEDITLSFEIESLPYTDGKPKDSYRIIKAKAFGLPKYEKNNVDNRRYNKIFGYFGENGVHKQVFYYRNMGGKKLKLKFSVEGKEAFKIRNIRVHSGTYAITRAFENGIILINPSFNSYKFDLKTLYPKLKFRRIKGAYQPNYNNGTTVDNEVIVNPLDALFLIKK